MFQLCTTIVKLVLKTNTMYISFLENTAPSYNTNKSDVLSLFVYLFFMNQRFVPGLERHSSSSDGCDQSMVIWLRQQQAFLVTLVKPIAET